MGQIPLILSLLLPALGVVAVAVLKILALKKENALLGQQLTETSVSLEKTRQSLEKLQQRHEEMVAFRADLHQAEQTVRQAVPKVRDFQPAERKWAAPERYGYIHTLASRGMPVEEIAAILTVSPHEVRQVLNLSRIGHGSEGGSAGGGEGGDEGAALRFSAGSR